MNFESFYTDLKSDEVWFTNCTMNHKPETVLEVARDLFMACSADNSLNRPIGDMRRYFWNKLKKITPDKVRKPWAPKEETSVGDPPLTGEARQKRIKEFLEVLAKVGQPVRNIPEKDVFDEGQWDKKKLVQMVPSKVEQIIAAREHLETAQRARRKLFTDAFPDAQEDEILAYLDKFKEIDNPLGL